MRLILSSRHPRNSTYSTETGQVLYKVDKPLKLGNSVATVRKVVGTVKGVWNGDTDSKARARSPLPDKEEEEREKEGLLRNGDHRSMDSQDAPFADSDSEDEAESSTHGLPVLEGHFAFYAQVEFHTFASTRFRYSGLDVSASDFFRKEGWSWFGRGRAFKASDGKGYRWDLRLGHLEMVRNDGTNKRLIKFREHWPSLRPFMKGRPASLEVDDSCEPVLDEIIMTFIYCHKLWKDRERRQRYSANLGAGSGN